MEIEKEKRMYQMFCNYIEVCKKQNKILWDSIASSDLLEPGQKEKHFIKNFELTNEFKYLIKELEKYDIHKSDAENTEEYYRTLQGCLAQFFINTGIYDQIILGKEFNQDNAFDIFLRELKKDIVFLKYGEVFPLKIENNHSIQYENFSLEVDLKQYSRTEETNFVFIVEHSPMPLTFNEIVEVWLDIPPFSEYLLLLNLYFDRPIYLRGIFQTNSSLFSHLSKKPVYYPSQYTNSAKDNYEKALQEYIEEKYPEKWFEVVGGEEPDWHKWDEWDRLKAEKEEEFINSDKAPINYLKEKEIAKFKEFVNKTRKFLKSDIYKTKKYFEVATHYFLMAHERPDIADNLVNYVIALEALYFYKEIPREKEHFGIRIANLLGGNLKVKKEIKSKMSKVYDLRCDYVHGNITNVDKNFSGQENWLRNILRFSLLSFFSLGEYYSNKKREELLDNLDSVFDPDLIKNIQRQTSDFLCLSMPYNFVCKVDGSDEINL